MSFDDMRRAIAANAMDTRFNRPSIDERMQVMQDANLRQAQAKAMQDNMLQAQRARDIMAQIDINDPNAPELLFKAGLYEEAFKIKEAQMKQQEMLMRQEAMSGGFGDPTGLIQGGIALGDQSMIAGGKALYDLQQAQLQKDMDAQSRELLNQQGQQPSYDMPMQQPSGGVFDMDLGGIGQEAPSGEQLAPIVGMESVPPVKDFNTIRQELLSAREKQAVLAGQGSALAKGVVDQIDRQLSELQFEQRQSIDRQSTKEAQIERSMNDLGMTRQEAIKYADGLIKVMDDKDTGQPYVYDLTTGEYRLLQAPLPDLGITLPESEAKQGVPQTLAEALPLGTGLWSAIANVSAAGAGQFGEDLAPEVVQARAMFDNAERAITKAVAINPERPLAIDIKNVQKIFSGASMKSPTQAKNQLVVLKQQIINQLTEDVAIYNNTSAPYNVRQESAARATELNKVLGIIGDVENVPLGSPKAAAKNSRRTQPPKSNNGGFSIRRLD